MVAVFAYCLAASLCVLMTETWSLPLNGDAYSSGPYTGYQVMQLAFNDSHAGRSAFTELQNKHKVDVWGHSKKGHVDVMVGPDEMNDVTDFLRSRRVPYKIHVPDVQRLLDDHYEENRHHRDRRAVPAHSVTRRYLRYRQIRQFLQNARDNATNADVTLSSLGRTFEQRITPIVTIRQKNSRVRNKRAVVIEAGIHAREWIAPAMALNIIYKLAFNPDNDSDVEELLERFDWIIIPVTNPDGYVFSHKNSSTRLWRKTRTTLYARGHPHCIGVDGNRNFGYEWNDSPERGGSSNPCADNYSGPQGFSEPETRNLRSLLLRLGTRAALYLSLHAYGQFFLFPWGYNAAATLEDEEDLMAVGQHFSDMMWQRNRWYDVGSSAKVLYVAAGASDDYAKGGAGIKYSFTLELSPTDSSPHGFLLPPRRIRTVVDDHWPAFKAIANTIWNKLNQTGHNDSAIHHNTHTTNSNNDNHGGNSREAHRHPDAQRRRSGSNATSAITEVTINGQSFRVSNDNPAMVQWMQSYLEYLAYRRRFRDWNISR